MCTAKQPERTIVIRAVYVGKEPAMSNRKEPFFLGNTPIIEPITKGVPVQSLISYGKPFHYVEFLKGGLSYDHEGEKVGVSPESVLVIFDVPVSEAEKWNEIESWKFERLAWTKYREIIQKQFDRISRRRDSLVERLTTGWTRFYNLSLEDVSGKVIRLEARIDKHERDPEFPSTDRYHYHVNLRKVRINDLFSAIEYIEQAFYLLGVECDVSVSVDVIEVYSTPKGLTDEKTT